MTARGPAAPGMGRRRFFIPMILVALASLLLGLWAGLARIGWDLRGGEIDLMLRHGGLMVVGFVATVIAVERAVAVKSVPAFAAPALSALTGLSLLAGRPADLTPVLATAAGVAYAINIGTLLYRHRQPAESVLFAGALALAVSGFAWWLQGEVVHVVPFWMAFLALTVAGERLELIRFQRFTRRSLATGVLALAALPAGALVTLAHLDAGARLMGVGLVLIPAWLVTRDIARRTVRTNGLAQFTAAGVLAAYAWLAVTGVLLLARGLSPGLHYDAAVHAFFTGFVFSAIMAHEPIIAPAISGLRFAYSRALYAPLALLNAGLVLRVAADLAESSELRRWAGLVQALAICLFLGLVVLSAVLGRRQTTALPARVRVRA